MRVRSKRLLTLMLAASMVTANLGTAFAQNLGKPSITEWGKTATVTLDANGGAFGKEEVGSPSNATPGNATPPDASASDAEKVKKIEVALEEATGTQPRYYYTHWYNAQSQMANEGILASLANSGYEFDCWTTKKNDLSTEVTANDLLFSDITLYANWKKEVQNTSSISGIYASGLGEGQTLTVSDLAEEKTAEELKEALKSNKLGFKNIIRDIKPIQLDIKPSENYKKGTAVTITMPMPSEMYDRAIAIVHFTSDNKVEVIAPTIRNYSELSFTLTSFSPVIILAAERDCKVVVEPAKGGYTKAYTLEYDEETGTNTKTYLPIGEDVIVPYNTEVRFQAVATERADKWRAVFEKVNITAGNRTDVVYDDYSGVSITGDTVIRSDFVKKSYSSSDDEDPYLWIDYEDETIVEAGSKASTSLDAYFYDGKTDSKVTEKTVFKLVEDEFDYTDNEYFEINGNVVTSKKALEMGEYVVEVEGTYTNSDGKVYSETAYLYFSAGTEMSLRVYFAAVKNEHNNSTSIHSDYIDSFYTSAKTFGEALKGYDETEASIPLSQIKMYNHENAGWYQSNKGKVNVKATEAAKLSTGYNSFYLRFSKDGKLYEAKIDKLPDSDTPLPPDDDDDNKGGNGGHGGGSGSSSSSRYSGSSNMSGAWKSDANGWWFQKTDGSYAKSEWGMINGKWYWFNEAGYMATGWVYYNGRWYYMDDTSGAMTTSSWVLKDGKWYYLTGDGGMLSGQWFLYKEAWYYLDESGAMITNGTTPDGYQVNADGVWVQ